MVATVQSSHMLLPPMPFGAAQAYSSSQIKEFTDNVASAIPNLQSFDVVGDSRQFHYRFASVNLNGIQLIANVCSPIQYRVHDSEELYVWIPFHGHGTAKVPGHNLVLDKVNGVFLTPNTARSGVNTSASLLQATLQRERLIDTTRAMLGDAAAHDIQSILERPNTLDFRQGHIHYKPVFWRLCQLIDDLRLDETLLALQGVDDKFHRTLVMMLLPEYSLQEGHSDTTPNIAPIDRVCDYIQAHLTKPITLSQLEHLSGLTARSLRYAFQNRFQYSPMQWLQQQRLERARQQLSKADPTDTVACIAQACGISRLTTFEPAYLRRFGEKPSETLARALRR